MSYYNHEAMPWPRRPAMEQNDRFAYDSGYSEPRALYQEYTSSFNNNPRSDNGWEPNTSLLGPQKGQTSGQTKRRGAEQKTATDMKNCLLEGIARPVESSKAERMMQMMGWQGGALGKTGGGLKEPLAPNLTLQSGAGLGHKKEEKPHQQKQTKKPKETNLFKRGKYQKKAKQPTQTEQKKHTKNPWTLQSRPEVMPTPLDQVIPGGAPTQPATILYSYHDIPEKNTLCDIYKGEWPRWPKKKKKTVPNNCPIRFKILEELLSFVNDNKAVGMKYSPEMSDARRKLIHKIVESVRSKDIELNSCGLMHPALSRLFTEICECNEYVLQSQSEGVRPLRQLFVFKEAPEHVYLITKDDLEEDNEKKQNGKNQSCKIKSEVVPKDEQNELQSNVAVAMCDEDKVIIKQENDAAKCEVISKDERNKLQYDAAVAMCDEDKVIIKQENEGGKTANVENQRCEFEVISRDEQNNLQSTAGVSNCNGDEKVIIKQENDVSVDATSSNHIDTVEPGNGNIKTESDDYDNNTFLNALIIKQDSPMEPPREIKLEKVDVKSENTKQEKDAKAEVNRDEHIKDLLKEYLEEFFTSAEYTEMRFLGEFDDVEQRVINDFITNLKECLHDIVTEDNWLLDTVLDNKYTIQFDKNGSEIIVKWMENLDHLI